MAPPTNSRGGSSSRGSSNARNSRGSGRGGGPRSRGGGAKVDKNGDVIMGNNPVAKGDGIRKSSNSSRGRGGSRAAATTEQKMRRHLGITDGGSLAKRVSELPRKKLSSFANRKVFTIVGLEQSKAASNADRGEKGMLEFLERKSSNMGRGVKIIKVCIR